MPWRPPPGEASDARLDPFRNRAGLVLEDGGVEFARLYVEAETYFEQVKGHLWWRAWSAPYEVIHGYMLLADGQFTDWVSDRAELEKDTADWLSGCFQYVGVKYHVVWLSAEESRRVRDEIFGDDPLRPDGTTLAAAIQDVGAGSAAGRWSGQFVDEVAGGPI